MDTNAGDEDLYQDGSEDDEHQLSQAHVDIHSRDSQNQPREKNKTSRRPKGPPITCLLCKKVWDKAGKGGRLFMFGGSRPFMAKFEAKMKALVGKEELDSLKALSATKFGRSYICRECYMLVRQAYDGIRNIQRGVAKSVEMVTSASQGRDTWVDDGDDSGSDQDLDIEFPESNSRRRTLPPVSERIAQKIASTTYVTINHKAAVLRLKRVREDDLCIVNRGVPLTCTVATTQKQTPLYENGEDSAVLSEDRDIENKSGSVNTVSPNYGQQHRSEATDTVMSSKENFSGRLLTEDQMDTEASSGSTSTKTFAPHNSDPSGSGGVQDGTVSSQSEESVPKTVDNTISNLEEGNKEEGDGEETIDIEKVLSNPLLLVKSRQPIQLAEVKNGNIFICTQRGCDWVFTSKFFWENHIRHFHCSGKPYQCPFEGCGRSFTGKSKLELHVRSHTDERPFICDKCGHGFRGNQELKAHKLTHTNEKAYQCPKCDKNFKLLSSMKRHLQFHDGNLPYQCDYQGCKKAFKSKYDLKCHYRLHTGEKPYKCQEPGCGMAFRIPCQFTMHKRAHTGERPFACTVAGCNMAYASSNTLQAHMLTHSTDRPYCCEFCGKTLKHKLMYKAHLKKHEGPTKLASAVDENVEENGNEKIMAHHLTSAHTLEDRQSWETNLQRTISHEKQHSDTEHNSTKNESQRVKNADKEHLPSHKINKKEETMNKRQKLSCPFNACGREYEDAPGLEDHLTKAHAPAPREKMCHMCGLAFPTAQELESHSCLSLSSAQQNSGFVCKSERCGLRFSSQHNLTDHVNWHLGNPPYRCEFNDCHRTFLLEKAHTAHMKNHKILKPFACKSDQCFENFDSQLKLLKHSKVHYGFFKCPFDGCNKTVKTLNTARLHMQVHEKPFACFSCEKRFPSSSQWLKHKASHTDDIPTMRLDEDCVKTLKDNASLNVHQGVHSEVTNLCSECGQVFTVTAKKHQCRLETEESGEKLTMQPQLPQVPQQQIHCLQYNQQHHHHGTHNHKSQQQQQHHSNPPPVLSPLPQQQQQHFYQTFSASTQQSLFQPLQPPSQILTPLSSQSSSLSSSSSMKPGMVSHLVPPLQDPGPVHPSQYMSPSPTLRAVSIPDTFRGNTRQRTPQLSPISSQQYYNISSAERMANRVPAPQSYVTTQAAIGEATAALALGVRQSFGSGPDTRAQDPANYSYIGVGDRPAQR